MKNLILSTIVAGGLAASCGAIAATSGATITFNNTSNSNAHLSANGHAYPVVAAKNAVGTSITGVTAAQFTSSWNGSITAQVSPATNEVILYKFATPTSHFKVTCSQQTLAAGYTYCIADKPITITLTD
jgi:hypothetical protein